MTQTLFNAFDSGESEETETVWLLTCSPRIIAEACAAAIKEGGGA